MHHKKKHSLIVLISVIGFGLVLTGCAGTKLLKEPAPVPIMEPLATSSDEKLSVELDWVIVRDGPGAWAKNADWDEYLLRVRNLSDEKLVIVSLAIYDSLEMQHRTSFDRASLVRSSRAVEKHYKDQGIRVKAGVGAATLVLAGGAAWSVGFVSTVAALQGSATALTTAGAAVVAAPVLVAGGLFRGYNNRRVDKEIFLRHTYIPFSIEPGEEKSLNVFFPLSPSPLRLEFGYEDSLRDSLLIVDLRETLSGLHISTN